MTTIRGLAATFIVFALVAAGCSAAAGSPPPSVAPSSSTTSPAATMPDDPVAADPQSPAPGGGDPAPGQPTLVLPKPGQKNVHPVGIEQIEARVAGRHVVLNARWWSGVEPCSVLDSVAVKQDGRTFTISVREGSGADGVACIDIAMLKATPIDLGDLDPGTYTIVAGDGGQAPPITVTVG
ncbi:MAG TPA: hypothetical protein VKA85_03600 [Candidatus Limnocylindrales bacterium]|nr:hypothetical protein [Candidatus Limnocylindrales bacterium]